MPVHTSKQNLLNQNYGGEGQENQSPLCWVQVWTWVWVQKFSVGSQNYGICIGIWKRCDHGRWLWIYDMLCIDQKYGDFPQISSRRRPTQITRRHKRNWWDARSIFGSHQIMERYCCFRKQTNLYGLTGGFTAHLTHTNKLGYPKEGGWPEKVPSWWRISSVSIWWNTKLVLLWPQCYERQQQQ